MAASLIIASPEMEATHYGVPVCALGEDGDAIALTGDTRRALAALNAYFRGVCGLANLLDKPGLTVSDAYRHLKTGWAVFTRPASWPGEDPAGWWDIAEVTQGTRGAVPVTWLSTVPYVHDTPDPEYDDDLQQALAVFCGALSAEPAQ